MKLGLLTWFHYNNYGTALQLYALFTYLKSQGHEVEVIQYYPQKMGKVLPDYSIGTIARNVIGRRFAKLIPLSQTPSQKNTHIMRSQALHDKDRDILFDEFRNRVLKFSPICATLSDLESLNSQYDAFICGSDQIWAPSIFDPHYFLDFVADSRKTISYAPSIGLPKVENKHVYRQMSELIRRIHYLSVREEKGASIIKDMTGREATVVVDPTFLLTVDHWASLAKRQYTQNEPYLIAYMLGSEESHWDEVYRIAELRHLSVRVIPVFEHDRERNGCITAPVGPEEFLSLIKNATYVCTDSFHGTIFSLIFHRQFSVFERFSKDSKINQNSRVYNLLNATDTLDRLIPYGKTYETTNEIAFKRVDVLLDHWIKNSKQFLFDSLNNVSHEKKQVFPNHILSDHSLCCGCGACAYVCPKKAISIKMNGNGFYQAIIDENKCINCSKCKTVCQFESRDHGIKMENGIYYSYKDNDCSVLLSSSSGGAAYRLAATLIEAGYAVVGCTFDKSLQRATHVLIDNKEELYKLQGSKYMQSSFSQILPLIAVSSKPVAVFGTPCQIAATRMLFPERNDYLYIDLICHGVPTYNLFIKYKKYLAQNYGSDPESIQIYNRYKPKGWRVIHTYTSDGQVETCFDQKQDYYFRMFESMNCYSPACYDCKWRDSSMADLRVGDFWGPLFEKDTTGVSIIGCMTENGAKTIELLQQSNHGELIQQSSENYLKYQQTKNYVKPLFYGELMNRFKDHSSKLSFIVEKYAEPFERHHIERDKFERKKHVIRLILDEFNQ